MRDPGHALPDEGHRAGHAVAALLAPGTLRTPQPIQHGVARSVLRGGEPPHHRLLQSTSPLWSNGPQNASEISKETLHGVPPTC